MSDSIFFIDEDISKAKTLPSKFYLNQEYFDLSINKIFKKSWQIITDINYIGKNNTFPFILLKDTLNEPLFLSIDNNKINCLSNVCTHRGSLLCKQNTNSNYIKCPYHGRTFNLDGFCKSAPGFKGANNFPNSMYKNYDGLVANSEDQAFKKLEFWVNMNQENFLKYYNDKISDIFAKTNNTFAANKIINQVNDLMK